MIRRKILCQESFLHNYSIDQWGLLDGYKKAEVWRNGVSFIRWTEKLCLKDYDLDIRW